MNEVWKLFEAGRYEEVCATADRKMAEIANGVPNNAQNILGNKMLALCNLGRFEEVIVLCKGFIDSDLAGGYGTADTNFSFLGMAHWFLGRIESALAAWQEAVGAQYKDAAGGVEPQMLLYYAGLRLHDAALQKEGLKGLKRIARRKSIANWPGSGALYLLGIMDREQLLASLPEHPVLHSRAMCQAAFYQGVLSLRDGNREEFLHFMHEARSQDPICRLEFEYYLAGEKFRLTNEDSTAGPPPLL